MPVVTRSTVAPLPGAPPRPVLRLGGASPGGLALPPAAPTPGQMYAPRGVWTDGQRLAAVDTGNHRVLLWSQIPGEDGADADVVLGQPDPYSEGPAAGGRGVTEGLHVPTGVCLAQGRLVVADAWHHRLLVWDDWPTTHSQRPDMVLGQPDMGASAPNAGGEASATAFYWPFGIGVVAGVFWVADTGNRRVLGWTGGLPDPGQPADVLLGQDTMGQRAENRGGAVGAATFRWPHAVAGDDRALFVADAGDHRVLGWCPQPAVDRAAEVVLGQPDASTASELAYRPQGPARLRFPYAVVGDRDRLVVADTANNRVLVFTDLPAAGSGLAATAVLGQPDFDDHGENRWDAVAADTFCWPYGMSLAGDTLAVADSGNNRVTVWQL